jgi:hypothetical protein
MRRLAAMRCKPIAELGIKNEQWNALDLILRSRAKHGVSKEGCKSRVGRPSFETHSLRECSG